MSSTKMSVHSDRCKQHNYLFMWFIALKFHLKKKQNDLMTINYSTLIIKQEYEMNIRWWKKMCNFWQNVKTIFKSVKTRNLHWVCYVNCVQGSLKWISNKTKRNNMNSKSKRKKQKQTLSDVDMMPPNGKYGWFIVISYAIANVREWKQTKNYLLHLFLFFFLFVKNFDSWW